MAAVFIDPRSLAVYAQYKVSHGGVHIADIAQYCLSLRTHFWVYSLFAGVIKELVSLLCFPQSELLDNIQFEYETFKLADGLLKS